MEIAPRSAAAVRMTRVVPGFGDVLSNFGESASFVTIISWKLEAFLVAARHGVYFKHLQVHVDRLFRTIVPTEYALDSRFAQKVLGFELSIVITQAHVLIVRNLGDI